jgi:hypothetical protein
MTIERNLVSLPFIEPASSWDKELFQFHNAYNLEECNDYANYQRMCSFKFQSQGWYSVVYMLSSVYWYLSIRVCFNFLVLMTLDRLVKKYIFEIFCFQCSLYVKIIMQDQVEFIVPFSLALVNLWLTLLHCCIC